MHKVLIVDDSATARRVLGEIISADPNLEVVGFAQDGHEAIAMTKQLKPDVITMDIHMPGMDGLEATKEVMIESPTPIVIVSANPGARQVENTMQALRAGALTVLLKPVGPQAANFSALSKELVSTLHAMADVMVIRHRRRCVPPPETRTNPPSQTQISSVSGRLRVIAIVASTGGPPALAKVLGQLPADFPVPIVVVQHIVPSFLPGFTSWLDSVVPMRLEIASDHQRMQGATIYVAPPGRHLGVTATLRLRLSDAPPIDGFRPAGSYLFASLADSFAKDSVGVILTGMGRDGVDGLKQLRLAGGYTVAQDESTSVVYGMPRVAVEEHAADAVVPLDQIGNHLLQLVATHPRSSS